MRFPLSLRNVEDLLHERGVDVSHEVVRFWRLRFLAAYQPMARGSQRANSGKA